MEENSRFPSRDDDPGAPIERRTIRLRGYVESKPRSEREGGWWTQRPSRFVLFFDTETNDDAAQRLRFGCYQLWEGDSRRERGFFYEPENVKPTELAELRRVAASRGHRLITATNFVDRIFYASAKAGATIVGFNLPFDISRLAIGHETARAVGRQDPKTQRKTVDRSMQGGFTFKLSHNPSAGNVRVKHLSRRAAFINFAGEAPSEDGAPPTVERGFFVDLRTLSAALTSQSHTLDSLATLLKTATRKAKFSDFGRDIDEEFITYAIDDVEVTRDCYQQLIAEYDKHQFPPDKLPSQIYSEASLGKAYLETMNIRPWRRVQRDFPDEILGAIMASYFGGRAEVHRRREVVRTIYCDFVSMYPTVCTLQGLWRFVIATGIGWQDATADTSAFLADCDIGSLQDPTTWKTLPTLVRVTPDAEIFPVRAKYGRDAIATIGLNYLSSDRGLWFMLADCVASKLLTGKAPKVERAVRFTPRAIQPGLSPINIRGNPAYRIVPNRDDFYRRLIDLRRSVKEAEDRASKRADKERLHSEQLALKILANATSYGIFIEINPEDLDEKASHTIHTGDREFDSLSDKLEVPGTFFHPLLATLITGAARLMLAITERLATDHGLDWAFCDTDSMAFAKPAGRDKEISEESFQKQVGRVCDWFEWLNPYEAKGSILEMEEQNFVTDPASHSSRLETLYCYAISAKRYALFNIAANGTPIIRKASAHGLGHLYPPYGNEDPDGPETRSGVLPWQTDVWRNIVAAALRGEPQPVPFVTRQELALPAASRYSATTPHILGWFRPYNEGRPYAEQIRPFGFLTWFHTKRPEEHFWQEGSEGEAWDPRARAPKPVAPYNTDISKAADNAHDRETWEPVPRSWLRTYAETVRLYHLHPETKFLGGGHVQIGPLRRRHVFAAAVEYIGKEADWWEEDSHFGADEDSAIAYGPSPGDRGTVIEAIRNAVRVDRMGVKRLAKQARVADRAVTAVVSGDMTISGDNLVKLHRAAEELLAAKRAEELRITELFDWVKARGVGRVAEELGYDRSNIIKVLSGRIRPKRVITRMRQLQLNITK
jgi:hypothetical protein